MKRYAVFFRGQGAGTRMTMLQRNTIKILTGALLVSCILSACDTNKTLNAMFGQTRTVPDGAQVDFGTPHPPILNPGAMGNPGTGDMSGQVHHVPEENAVSQPSSSNSVPGQRAPISQQPMAVSAMAKASPSAVGDMSSPPADTSTYPTLTNVPPAPVVQSKEENTAQFNSLTTQRALSESARQQLMGDPSATVLTSPQTGQMVGSAGDVITPSAPPPIQPAPARQAGAMLPYAPVPVQVVQAPAAPLPQPTATASSGAGFDKWLHNLFSSDDNAAPATPVTTARKMPVENIQQPVAVAPAPSFAAAPVVAPAPAMASNAPEIRTVPAAVQQDAFVAPPEAVYTPQQAPQQIISAPLPNPPAAMVSPAPMPLAQQAPIHLTPPPVAAGSDPLSSAPMQADNYSGAAVRLVPPSSGNAVNSSSSGHYLTDSRYEQRRTQSLPADGNSD